MKTIFTALVLALLVASASYATPPLANDVQVQSGSMLVWDETVSKWRAYTGTVGSSFEIIEAEVFGTTSVSFSAPVKSLKIQNASDTYAVELASSVATASTVQYDIPKSTTLDLPVSGTTFVFWSADTMTVHLLGIR